MLHSQPYSDYQIPDTLLQEHGEDGFTLHTLLTLNYDEYFPELAGMQPLRIEVGVHKQRVRFVWHEHYLESSTTKTAAIIEFIG